ncbi:hypothetical protein [Streptomyces cacaoi]|nr:hypothetical protein [Streptomyces cacaoi]
MSDRSEEDEPAEESGGVGPGEGCVHCGTTTGGCRDVFRHGVT